MTAGNAPLLLLKSPLGDDTLPDQHGTLHAVALAAREQISQPFEVELTVVTDDQALDPVALLHQPVSVTCRRFRGLDRHFSGLVRRIDTLGTAQRDRWRYRLVVVPRLWFLSQAVDCRIFQQMTAVEILGRLFSEQGVEPVDFRIFGPQRTRVYTTQFNETDLDFVHRLLQESGCFYFFEHQPDGSTLVVTDRNEAFRTMQRPDHRLSGGGDNVDVFDRWEKSEATTFGRVRLQDYDPTRPAQPVQGQRSTVLEARGAVGDVFRWPAMTLEDDVAADRARFRMQAAEAAASLRQGHGHDPNLCPGHRFALVLDQPSDAADVRHVVHGATHRAVDETWLGGTAPSRWDTDFTCFLAETPWREEPSIPRPAMGGIYSAIVLAPDGEEIHADPLARIKVRPLFDHRRDTVVERAIWIRILNAWAGDRWGWQHLPRAGTEVGLSFMNGDPDSPVVIGCFYNEEMRPVFDTTERKTVQGFRSRTTLRGGREEYSELSFDDRRGAELLLLHAQKDHRVEVERDQTDTIGNDRMVNTVNDDSLTARNVLIEAAETITLRVGASSVTLTLGGISLSTPDLVSINGAAAVLVDSGGLVSVDAGGDVNLAGGGAVTIEAGGDVNIAGGGAVTVETGDGSPVVLLPSFV